MIRTRQQGDTPFFPNMLNNGKVEVCLKADVDKVIAELKEERRWRNLKDEQPQEGERVLIVDEYFQDISMAMYTDDHCWELNSGATILTTAFPYWMPLPSAPKEADK